MTTAFQYIFDNAESISINKRPITSQSISRDLTVRSISRGGQIWRFDVALPNGMPWDTARPFIEAIEYAGRTTEGTVQINNAGYNSWLTNYRGNCISTSGFVADVTEGSNVITLTANPSISSGNKFAVGDIIQLASGHVYSVVENTNSASNTVTLNRSVLDATGSYALFVGPDVTWNVICVGLPTWSIGARNQVSWSGAFSFYEVV
jgi:hypothetical protein